MINNQNLDIHHSKTIHPIPRFLINEKTVIFFISINTLALFFDAFPSINQVSRGIFSQVDHVCLIYFVIEAVLKITILGIRGYWANNWNRFDLSVVLLSLLTFLPGDADAFSTFLLLRLGRLFRFFRLLRFIPDVDKMWKGILRSLRASVGIFLALLILHFILAMGATMLFSGYAPEHFGNPLKSMYSLFKVFTVEGWYEIPDLMYQRSGSAAWAMLLKGYFIVSVLIGGVLGLSLANAVFVDEMTADNTDRLENMVENVSDELKYIRELIEKLEKKDS